MSEPISARVDGTHYTHSIAPDVCWTPMGSIVVPVAYSTIAFYDNVDRSARTVRNNGSHDFTINTRPNKVIGHEAGTQKGVVVPGHLSHAVVKTGASNVFSEGWPVVRNNDPGEINRPGPGTVEIPRSEAAATVEHS